MTFFSELKRRNVIRMAGLYLVGAWLTIQIAETLLPAFDVPGWVLRAIIVVLGLGFVPALVISWLFEMTPDGLKRESEIDPAKSVAPQTARRMDLLTLAGVLLVVAVIAADRYWPQAPVPVADDSVAASSDALASPAAAEAAEGADTADANSIAVLPFVNMSADPDNEYFSDGISEELLNVLVKVDGLSVASRTSSFAYKGREQSAASIGDELNVANVLEGSVRKSGSRVRITAQLIDARSDRHLWSETYDRELTDIFAIQDEIAKAIVAALSETLGDRLSTTTVAVRADTDNLDAYQLYLKARELFLTRTDLDESVRLFEQVVSLDPEFARGWEGLAAVTVVIVDWANNYPGTDQAAMLARSAQAAERALALDDTLALPWAARSLVARYQQPVDYVRLLELNDRAIAADPRNPTVYLWRGIIWLEIGFIERGLDDLQRCLDIDPAYGNCLRWKALVLLFMSRTDEALALYQQGMATGFNSNRGNSFVEPLIRRGDQFAAILLMRELEWPVDIQQAVVTTVNSGLASTDAASLIARVPGKDRQVIQLSLLLRDYPLAAEQYQLYAGATFVEFWDPIYAGLRGSPAFKRIVNYSNAPAYWRAKGFPPGCRALGDDDFECDEVR